MYKPIEDYENYFISDEGEVISFKYKREVVLSKRINSRGYYYVNLCKNGKYKSISIHRLVGKYFVDNPDPEKFGVLNHIDGNKLNNHYTNLEWCDTYHNMKEAFRLGLCKARRGADSNLYTGKITVDIANEIRKVRRETGLSHQKIADMYNISRATVTNILNNKIYT